MCCRRPPRRQRRAKAAHRAPPPILLLLNCCAAWPLPRTFRPRQTCPSSSRWRWRRSSLEIRGLDMTRDEAIADITHKLVEFYQPTRIYLFGSVARGDDGPDSDLDFLRSEERRVGKECRFRW